MSPTDRFDMSFGAIQPLAKIRPSIPTVEEVEDDIEQLDRGSIDRQANRTGLTDAPQDSFSIAFGSIKPIAADHRQPGVEPGAEPVFKTEGGIEYSPYDLPVSEARKLQAKPNVLRTPAVGSKVLQGSKTNEALDLTLFLKKHEGAKEVQRAIGIYRDNRFQVYTDTSGNDTIGYGHNLRADKGYIKSGKLNIGGVLIDPIGGITDEQADALLSADIVIHRNSAARVFGKNWDKLTEKAKHAATEMAFNVGARGFRRYKKFQAALVKGDFETAAREARREGISDHRNKAIRTLLGIPHER